MTTMAQEQKSSVSSLNITLGELVVFINWMQLAQRALEQGRCLPEAPNLGPGEIRKWVELIHKQEEVIQRREASQRALEGNLAAQEKQLAPALSMMCENLATLYESLGHTDKAQAVRSKASGFQVD